ncbi:hypothetical protein SteCoe_4086 [Stentor coeruleus]|uniref:Telomere length regulation protein conserved domain-containing protein n=1 Tax=Stentor coeruleus TaxID=5963 RepID=A0A1R2CVH0_9CILI|nr:hypothetical protein SteCoe_4086 [Stentor coeruleus]
MEITELESINNQVQPTPESSYNTNNAEDEIIKELEKTWQSKVDLKVEWPIHKKILIKMPDKIKDPSKKLGFKYFLTLCTCAINMDLEDPYYYSICLDFLNTLIFLRKTDAIISSLKSTNLLKPNLLTLISELSPANIFFMSLFRSSQDNEIHVFFPSLPNKTSEFLCFQLPLKVYLVEESKKVSRLIKHYNLINRSLGTLCKIWADPLFLVHSPQNNKRKNHIALTIIIHELIYKNLDLESSQSLFPGIQKRLASNIPEVSMSGLVIASRVSQLLESKEIIEFTLDKYVQGETVIANEESSDEEVEKFDPSLVRKSYYMHDLVQGLISQDRDRFLSALNSASDLIKSDLSDMDLHLESLAEIFLKLENTFNYPQFEDLRFECLINLTYQRPEIMSEILTKRIQESCTINQKLLVLDVLQAAAKQLANPPINETLSQVSNKKTSKYEVIHKRLEKKTRRFHRKPKESISRPNYFVKYFEIFVSRIIKNIDLKTHYLVISKAAYCLSELIEHVGPTCDIKIISQCVYLMKFIIKPLLTHEKREVLESILLLLYSISQKLDSSSVLDDFPSLASDIQEIIFILEHLPDDVQPLAAKSLLGLMNHTIINNHH